MKDTLDEYNFHKMDEDIPWGFLSGTEQGVIFSRSQMNEYKNRYNMGVRDVNTKTNTRNGKKKNENIKDIIFKPDDDTVGDIPKWNLEPKVSKPGDSMVINGKNYYQCPNHHDRGICSFHKPDKFNVKQNQVKANAAEEDKDNFWDTNKDEEAIS